MKTDARIREDVLDQLAWESNIDDRQIGVAVENGVVTLSGVVDSYTAKMAAEKATKKVSGVKAVAEDIEVKYGDAYKKTDKEIAKAVVNALEWNISVPNDKIMAKVEDGWVYLSGEVKWDFQRNAAKKAVENLLGVKYVSNNIILKQEVKATDIKSKISKAFERAADLDAKHVSVEVDGHTVTLKGTVRSWAEKEEARKTAYASPGVYNVKNELKVEYYPAYA
ncbi:BON domain-containing protein [Winogradskyella sp.]|uniref:BON domain-containing protein n=1 Tax=uncultured Winogradskyella sp. TaxID=395353 RepID=UPI0023716643|nr:BON domain-containing protein [Winogradskyella sp.]MDC0006750.1 BON domain-containing protein [Winogradskyella sp.]MDC1504109.1 BON domain-containing protein [Winogradskyella sp.]|tara:strand:- start:6228 stop:6896 length:669 start_codon:yes stop_codon:yes gene_type:complete